MESLNLRNKILFSTVIFVFLISVLVDISSQGIISNMMEYNIYKTINGVCHETAYILKQKYSADFHLEDGRLFAGNVDLSEDIELFDTLKQHFDSEISIFYSNVRYLTTIRGIDGQRLNGTVQDDKDILDAVFLDGKMYQARNVMINGDKYYGVYRPLRDSSNVICGMIFAGISNDSVSRTKRHLFLTVFLISILACVAGIVVVSIFTKRMCRDLYYIREFLDRLSKNEMEIALNESVLSRHDEIGELGVHSVEISRNITELMNTDPLTHLMNRRSGIQLIEATCRRNTTNSRPLTFAMGDIDFFKQVNDTYGHAAGDDVLVKVSGVISRLCSAPDFVIRWGGEEFLIVMNKTCEQAAETLEEIRSRVESFSFSSDEGTFSVTITFGVTLFEPGEDSRKTISRADANLYVGKEAGRNRIVAD